MKSQNAYGTDLNTPTVEFITLLTLSFDILYESTHRATYNNKF